MIPADEVTVKKQEEKIGARNMIVANKMGIIKDQLGTTAVQVTARQQDTTGIKMVEKASTAVESAMWAKLGEPEVENITRADPEQEAAEDIDGRAVQEDWIDKKEKAEEDIVTRRSGTVSAHTIEDMSTGELTEDIEGMEEPAAVRGISSPDYLLGERYFPGQVMQWGSGVIVQGKGSKGDTDQKHKRVLNTKHDGMSKEIDAGARPAHGAHQSCQSGRAGVSGAQSYPVEALPAQTVSTMMAVSQSCQEGGAGVSGAQSHPVEELPAQNGSTLSAVSQSCHLSLYPQ